MTEESLQYLSLIELHELMLLTIQEYLVLHEFPDPTVNIDEKRDELILIQGVINRRKEEKPPVV